MDPTTGTPATAITSSSSAAATPQLSDCLLLLRGERDEQKLAGLLLAANICRAGDYAAVSEVYLAVGPRFLSRLLITGLGKGEGGKEEEREAYLRLAVTVLAALARVPEVAAAEGVVSTVHLVAEVVSKSPDLTITEECYELLSLIAIASDDGAYKFCEPGVMDMLFPRISSFPDGSRCLDLAVHLMKLLVHKLRADSVSIEKLQGMTSLVTSLARLFAVLHTAVKFDALHMLTTLLSQKESPLHGILRSMPSTIWESHIRVGITAVLQNRIVSSEKLQALFLAECMMCILGENWLSQDYKINNQDLMPVDKFVLLVLESARVEVAVLLNELAYLKYESSENSCKEDAISQRQRNLAISFSLIERIIKMLSNASGEEDDISQRQRNLAISFSLIERIIKMLSNASGGEGAPSQTIHERTIMQAISGLNETVNLVLDFLQDSKDHGQRKGDDLLAAVRIIGRLKCVLTSEALKQIHLGCFLFELYIHHVYKTVTTYKHLKQACECYLAEAPYASKEKTRHLLEYIFSIEGQDESSPFYSVCFMLPMLSQITMEADGCKILASFGGYKTVIGCLVKLINQDDVMIDNGSIFLACDTILNFLSSRKNVQIPVESHFFCLLQSLVAWAGTTDDSSVVMTASSLCTMVLDLTSEEFFLSHSDFDSKTLESLSQLIVRSFHQDIPEDDREQLHQKQIIVSGYRRWADRFPHVKGAVRRASLTLS